MAALRRALQRAHSEATALRNRLVAVEAVAQAAGESDPQCSPRRRRASTSVDHRTGRASAAAECSVAAAPAAASAATTAAQLDSGGSGASRTEPVVAMQMEAELVALRRRCAELEVQQRSPPAAPLDSDDGTHGEGEDSSAGEAPTTGAVGAAPSPLAVTLSASSALAVQRELLHRDEARHRRRQVRALAAENARLRGELAAFDASFFDALEELKWSYACAAEKCRAFDAYVRRYPPTQGLPEELATTPAVTVVAAPWTQPLRAPRVHLSS